MLGSKTLALGFAMAPHRLRTLVVNVSPPKPLDVAISNFVHR